MEITDVDKDMLLWMWGWFLEKVEGLKSGNKEIKIGKYTFIFRYARVKIKLDENYYDEVDFPAINPKATEDDLRDVILLVFDVKGMYKNYITELQIYRIGLDEFKIYIYPDRQQNDVEELFNNIYNVVYEEYKFYIDLIKEISNMNYVIPNGDTNE